MNFLVPQSDKGDSDQLDGNIRSIGDGHPVDSVLFETIADPVLLCRYKSDVLSSPILEANTGTYASLGYTREELSNQVFGDVIQPGDRFADRLRHLREGRRITCGGTCRRSDGTEGPVELHLTLRSLRDTALLCVVCRDTTDRKLARKRLRRSLDHQTVLTRLARLALRTNETSVLLDKTVRQISRALEIPCVGLFALTEDDTLRLRAGIGWGERACKEAGVPVDPECELGYTLYRDAPVRVDTFDEETRFRASDFLARAKIESSVSTAINTPRGRYGVLLAGSRHPDHFRREDEKFVHSVAELLSESLERHTAKRAVRRSETKYRRLFNESRDALFIVAPDGEILAANPAAEEMFGYDTWDVKAQDLYVDPDRRTLFRQRLEERGSIRDFEVQMRHRDGTIMHCLMTSTARWNADGQTDAYQTIIRDITSRKTAEEALRASEEKFRTFSEQALVGVCIIQDNILQYANPRFAEILGYTPEEIIGKKGPSDLVHPEDWDISSHHIQERLDGIKKTANYTFRAITKHGQSMHVEVYGTRINHEGAPAILGTMIDITDRRQLERQILQISEEERRRIGQDLHDGLGQTLTGIGMIAQNLAQNLEKHESTFAEMASEITDLIQEADRRAHDLAHGLTPVDLGTAGLPGALEQLSSRTEQLFDISCSVTCDPACSIADTTTATNLYRIAQEAVTNAVKHGGARHIEIRLHCHPGHLQLTVHDDGVGFDEKYGKTESGIGIDLMRYRARIVGGVLSIRERPRGGTELSCRIRTP